MLQAYFSYRIQRAFYFYTLYNCPKHFQQLIQYPLTMTISTFTIKS